MTHKLERTDLDYSKCRAIGTEEWCKVVDADYPTSENGTMAKHPDMLKLDDGYWYRLEEIEFPAKMGTETEK